MEQRNEYVKKLEENIVAYNKKLAEMKAKVAEVKADVKAEYLAQIDSIEKKTRYLRGQVRSAQKLE